MTGTALSPRCAEPRLIEALADSPVVLIHGPRQSGKTTRVDIAGARFAGGVVLYDGETSAGFGDRLHAVPLRALCATV